MRRRTLILLSLTHAACTGADDTGGDIYDPEYDLGADDGADGSGDSDASAADGSGGGDAHDGSGDPDAEDGSGGAPSWGVPLDPTSPWPKFRRDAAQTGATPIAMSDDGRDLWSFDTGKGIFSSPVIDADGTVYVGSASRSFYAIDSAGGLVWSLPTGEIIDSAGLLDDQGRVYFGSGDGFLYAADRATGRLVWTFQADDPATTGGLISWFEGNVAIAPDGTLLAPNDNFRLYGIDRATAEQVWAARMPDQGWSSPAVDVETGDLIVGNNNLLALSSLGERVFRFDARGRKLWGAPAGGSVAASPLLTPAGLAVVGAFDGYVTALNARSGEVAWSFAARDHVYASAAWHPGGYVVVPSADGTVYALAEADGALLWAFDWGAPLRSSPAVDAAGNIYVGSGDGYLVVIGADGRLRWALRLIDGDRNDLNASPALSAHAIVLAGESGAIFSVPFDYCLRAAEASNPRCLVQATERAPGELTALRFTTAFGSVVDDPPTAVLANQPLAFSLVARRAGDDILALIDDGALEVAVSPPASFRVDVAPNRQFVTLVPETTWADADGALEVTLDGTILVDPERRGLRMTGGTSGGVFSERLTFRVDRRISTARRVFGPETPGIAGTTWLMRRLAVPLPTLMPSYNQIGFDSLYFLVTAVDVRPESALVLVTSALPVGGAVGDPVVRPVPGLASAFLAEVALDGALFTLQSDGAELSVMNAAIAFDTFRVSGALDDRSGGDGPLSAHATARCGALTIYGSFLRALGLCNPATDVLTAWGAVLLDAHTPQRVDLGTVGRFDLSVTPASLTARFSSPALAAADHTLALIAVDAATNRVVDIPFGTGLQIDTTEGLIAAVHLLWGSTPRPEALRAFLVVDAVPFGPFAL